MVRCVILTDLSSQGYEGHLCSTLSNIKLRRISAPSIICSLRFNLPGGSPFMSSWDGIGVYPIMPL
jgi:hypothetical protein